MFRNTQLNMIYVRCIPHTGIYQANVGGISSNWEIKLTSANKKEFLTNVFLLKEGNPYHYVSSQITCYYYHYHHYYFYYYYYYFYHSIPFFYVKRPCFPFHFLCCATTFPEKYEPILVLLLEWLMHFF